MYVHLHECLYGFRLVHHGGVDVAELQLGALGHEDVGALVAEVHPQDVEGGPGLGDGVGVQVVGGQRRELDLRGAEPGDRGSFFGALFAPVMC